MLDLGDFPSQEHPNHVEPVGVARTVVQSHPGLGRLDEFELLPVPDRLDGGPPVRRKTGSDLDEGDEAGWPRILWLGCHEIDVAMSASEPTLQNVPAVFGQPRRRDTFALKSEFLSIGKHTTNIGELLRQRLISFRRVSSFCGNWHNAAHSHAYVRGAIRSRSSSPINTSRGLEPSGGPSIPAVCN